jgi:hypothetical protein
MSPSEEEELSDAEREWRESLQQLELLLTMVLVPYLGKYFGRKCAYWGMTDNCWISLNIPLTIHRLGPFHDVEIPGVRRDYQPRSLQGCGCG